MLDGAVFRRIDRWGRVAEDGLHVDSLLPLLRRILGMAGVGFPDLFSTHSLRRGFANWASTNGWDLKELMEHVGWKSAESALRYINPSDPYGQARIERVLARETVRVQGATPEE
jgi:integrase